MAAKKKSLYSKNQPGPMDDLGRIVGASAKYAANPSRWVGTKAVKAAAKYTASPSKWVGTKAAKAVIGSAKPKPKTKTKTKTAGRSTSAKKR